MSVRSFISDEKCFLLLPLQGRVQLAARLELLDDVQPADQIAVHVQLREGGPLREFFETLAHLVVAQNVERVVRVSLWINDKMLPSVFSPKSTLM